MNGSAANVSVIVQYRDSFTKAVIKNVIILVVGIFINYINLSLIHTFCKHQVFYMNPRYILFIHLVINDLIQVNVTIMLFVISYHLQDQHLHVGCSCSAGRVATENSPLNLACMALECYSAVCFPLHHLQVWTIKRTLTLILLMWTTTTTHGVPTRHHHTKRDVTYALFLVIIWITIFYTYFQILLTAKTAGKDTVKARNTIILHSFQLLLCMASYLAPALKDLLKKLFPKNSTDILFVSYIVVQVLPRSTSPMIYGLRDPTFRKYLKRYMLARSS
ncbi:hypothetical protein D4764_0097310 [Takifugu flavidus]|uniref:G-protein coupled receptors family 1 profile domain-containing protein n=1 Tax=Takifugu flavidus TaxID=433684 RepID=A0A5C6MJJ3_9TELE|nr:hypothetical protein D4764_0097310 [Takifugu flavidus]